MGPGIPRSREGADSGDADIPGMRTVRLALLAALAATLLSGSAIAQSESSLAAPQGLQPFLLRANETPDHVFSRTPSFSWNPVRGALRYEFQLGKTASFQEGTLFWASSFSAVRPWLCPSRSRG